ncbi:sulfurtransferase complex subunit TusD [Flocculibacter collagenilyticus]|uniref:sulfurtransferase complex subunit TusD n=1 Tax=Flocculibacter collagenilyticus TaxID=2744479 RepID=UPI0018F7BFAA|nr:sulfurtransferase complex subunit TusD [Flocculibacter collagenilyticus]
MASFIITLHASAFAHDANRAALSFCNAVVKQGHKLNAVFFYQDAVNIAHIDLDIPSDEFNAQTAFQQLQATHSTPLLLCVTAAEKRGIKNHSVTKPYTIAGLAEFAMLAATTDKVIQFK